MQGAPAALALALVAALHRWSLTLAQINFREGLSETWGLSERHAAPLDVVWRLEETGRLGLCFRLNSNPRNGVFGPKYFILMVLLDIH